MSLYIIISISLLYQFCSKLIILPFRTNKHDYLFSNNSDLLQKYDYQELYSEISVGTPSQKVNFKIEQENSNFYFGENICYKNSPSYYNYSKSKTFAIASFYDGDNGFTGFESFQLYKTLNIKNKTMIEHLDAYFDINLLSKEKKEICGEIGLSIKSKEYLNYSFLGEIKQKGYTDKYSWTYIYFKKDKNKIINLPEINDTEIVNNYEGILIFGEYPHEYYPNIYNKNDLRSVLAYERNNKILWGIIFSKIYYFNKKDEIKIIVEEEQAELLINLNYIICSNIFFENITQIFFRQYINDNKCKINKLSSGLNSYQLISCDKNFFDKNEIKKFPNIYFYHRDFNYTFNLTYNDLFEEYNGIIYFLIIFDNKYDNIWKFGKLFLTKYQFVFNQDEKTINFYSKFNENKSNLISNDFSRIFSNYIFWIVILLLFISLFAGIFVGEYIFEKKKNKNIADELEDDEYDYSLNNNK